MLIAHALRPFCYLNNKYKRKLHGKISHATYHAMTVFSLSSGTERFQSYRGSIDFVLKKEVFIFENESI